MGSKRKERGGSFEKLWRWITRRISKRVPDAVSVCEFDCRETDCVLENWEKCEYRTNFPRAAGSGDGDRSPPPERSP